MLLRTEKQNTNANNFFLSSKIEVRWVLYSKRMKPNFKLDQKPYHILHVKCPFVDTIIIFYHIRLVSQE